MREFFVSCGLGLENDLKNEIKEVWHLLLNKKGESQIQPFPEFIKIEGGLEFSCEYEIGLQLNYYLKIANRVLLRVAKFKATSNADFEKHLNRISWGEYFKKASISVDVSSHSSKIYHKKRIEEFVMKHLKNKLSSEILTSSENSQVIYIRFENDFCQVSIDTSGEHLHKRGLSVLKGEAPLRETLASWVLRKCIEGIPLGSLQNIQLIDPMCGSATFLTEALLLYSPNFSRKFAFQKFTNCPKILLTESYYKKCRDSNAIVFKKYFGFDILQRIVEIAQKNWLESLKSLGLNSDIDATFECVDVFNLKAETFENKIQWVVVNPPYGERLKITNTFNEMLLHFDKVFKPNKIAFLSPKFELDTALSLRYPLQQRYPVLHGGLRLTLLILEKES
ncbi:MAG TPA: hypothetical protein PLJ21_04055 [Pseudobdellovibrionaceae bacterium]|nr:hypothetical protein [Pseudobdellovibrionaceae bacterium]